jgi:hypothetical protein
MTQTKDAGNDSSAGCSPDRAGSSNCVLHSNEQEQRIQTIQANFDAGRQIEIRNQQQRDRDATLASLESNVRTYASKPGENPLQHLDRLRNELCSRHNDASGMASEVVTVVQSAGMACSLYKDMLSKAAAEKKDLEQSLKYTDESVRDDIEEIENLEAELKQSKSRFAMQAKELIFMRRAILVDILLICLLSIFCHPFVVVSSGLLLFCATISLANFLYHDTSVSQFIQDAKNTLQRVRLVLSHKSAEFDEGDDSLVPAHELNNRLGPHSRQGASSTDSSLRRRKTRFDVNPGLRSDASIASFNARLTAFYSKWAPAKLTQDDTFVSRTISKYSYEGGEELLFKTLVAKYGPEPTRSSTSTKTGSSKTSFHARLTAFYSKWAPEKLNQDDMFVPRLISRYSYEGGEERLFKTLVAKYGSEPA